MASIGGVSSSNLTSSLYNSANVISGLASGLDTESMIEGLVQSYQTKIQNLSNKATKLEWKQDAYRSIISKMYAFSNKYTSYSSATNLMSASFFNSAIKVAAMGKYKDAVTASGKTDSEVQLTSVKQLASAARFTTSGNLKGFDTDPTFAVESEEAVSFDEKVLMGNLSGSLSLNYGSKTVSIVFDPNTDIIEDYQKGDDGEYVLDGDGKKVPRSAEEKAADLAALINKKLGDTKITLSSGETRDGTDLIDVSVSGGKISFRDKSTGGNEVYLSDSSGNVANVLGLDLSDAKEDKPNTITIGEKTSLTQSPTVSSLISGKTMNISLDGKTKSIHLPAVTKLANGGYRLTPATAVKNKDGSTSYVYNTKDGVDVSKEKYAEKYAEMVNDAVKKEFGNKITVSADEAAAAEGKLKLKIQAPENSNMIVNSDAGKALGIGNTATNYLNTSRTLGELMKEESWNGLTAEKDSKGNDVYDFKINGVSIGKYGKDTKLSTILNDINANSEANVKVAYSQTTRTFSFTSKDTGAESKVEIAGGLAGAIFGSTKVDTSAIEKQQAKDFVGEELAGKELKLRVGDKDISYTIQGTSPNMRHILNAINGTDEMKKLGATASFSDTDGSLVVRDKSGKELDVELTNDFTKDLFGAVKEANEVKGYTNGQDAVFSVTVNGQEKIMTRSSNSADIDGLTLNFKDTFNADYIKDADENGKYSFDASVDKPTGDNVVSFQASTDSDKIVDAVKAMIADYNEMMAEVRTQYATLPYQKSGGSFANYEPLSDEDKATMSESAIQKYEEKAKQGILFGDRDLSSLYEKMRSIFSPGGTEEAKLQQMGISITYSSTDNSASVVLDESKLRSMLDSDPDAVADMFTRSAEAGAASDGIMQQMKTQLDRYGATTGATKGILVEQAGTPLSSMTLMSNTWQKQIDSINDDIEKWQDKLSAQVDKYTSMFSRLETLIYQMNSQSSTLAGLMGG